MDKNILRKEILERRNYLELDNKSKYDKVIFEKLINSDIYKVENASEYFVYNNNIYIIFAYGNNKMTSEKDIVII